MGVLVVFQKFGKFWSVPLGDFIDLINLSLISKALNHISIITGFKYYSHFGHCQKFLLCYDPLDCRQIYHCPILVWIIFSRIHLPCLLPILGYHHHQFGLWHSVWYFWISSLLPDQESWQEVKFDQQSQLHPSYDSGLNNSWIVILPHSTSEINTTVNNYTNFPK